MARIHQFVCRGIAAGSIALGVFASGEAPAIAQEMQAPILAIIDVQKVLRESVAVKSLTASIEEERDNYQKELRAQEDSLRTVDQELNRQRAILSAKAYAQKRKDLEQRVASLQRQTREKKRGWDQRFGKGISQVQNELGAVAKEIAEERGLDLIFSRATVVLVNPKFDISNEALKRLNARLITVALPTQQD